MKILVGERNTPKGDPLRNVTRRVDIARNVVESMQHPDLLPKGALQKYFAKRKEEEKKKFTEQKVYFEEKSRLIKAAWAPFVKQLGPTKYREIADAFQKLTNRREVRKVKPPRMQSVSPRITGGSLDLWIPPPYQDLPVLTNGNTAQASSNGSAGYARIDLGDAISGSASAQTGISMLYLPISGLPLGHCRPYIQTLTSWSIWALGECCHTTGTLTVTVVDILAWFFGKVATAGVYSWQRSLFMG